MRDVAALSELDLTDVLGLAVSPSVVAHLEELDLRLNRLERGRRRNGWLVGTGGRVTEPRQYILSVLERTLSFPAAVDDLLELSLTVWRQTPATLTVEATVLVNCFCQADHSVHQTAEREWTVETDDELRDAFDAAVTALEDWGMTGPDSDFWRMRVGLPARSRSQTLR